MKSRSLVATIVVLCALVFAGQIASGAIYTWNWTNGVSPDIYWSDSLNWSPAGVPGPADSLIFNSTNSGGLCVAPGAGLNVAGGGQSQINVANFNGMVDGNFGGSICAMLCSNFGSSYQNILITNNATFTITNGLTVGNGDVGATGDVGTPGLVLGDEDVIDYGATIANVTIAGTNATLNMNNTNEALFVSQGSATSSSSCYAQLDMSALDNFNATISRVLVGMPQYNRPGAVIYLAATNHITAEYQTTGTLTSDTIGTGAIVIGDATPNGGGANDSLYLGLVNTISADTIAIARQKQQHCLLAFNPNLTGPQIPTATIQGFSGSQVEVWDIGDGVANSGTDTCIGAADFSLGIVNAVVSNMYVGKGPSAGTAVAAATGSLTFGAGTINIGSLFVGYGNVNSAPYGVGTVTVNTNATYGLNATLIVNSNLNLGYVVFPAAAGGASTTGTLNVMGGTVWANNIVAGATSKSTLSIFGGSLVLTNSAGTAAAGLTTLNLSNAALTVSANLGAAPIVANSVTADYSPTDVTTINVTALPTIASFPVVITLIQSPNAINLENGAFSFVLGSLPTGYTGQIIQGGANNNLVELQINTGPQAPDVWTGADIPNHNTNWNDGANWSSSVPNSFSLVSFNSTGANSAQASSALSTPGGGPGDILTSKLNNIVTDNTTVSSLTYTNTGGSYENTSISTGDSLTLTSGFLTVGSPTLDFGTLATGNTTISGPGGTLSAANLNGASYISLGTATPSSTPQATLDMSGLGTFVSSNANLLVGVGGYSVGDYTVAQPSGVVYLAETNFIYAASAQPDTSDAAPVALEVGDADTLAGLPSTIYLGRTNAIFADNISIARQLGSGGIFFNPSVSGGSATAYIRGYSASAVANWIIGDGAANATSALASSGTNDFTGGTVNALANNIYVGNNSTGVGASGQVTGILNFDAGTVNVNNLNISYNAAASDGNVYNSALGTVNVGTNGLLVVNTNLTLAYVGGNAAYGTTPIGALNITNGGAVWANSIVPSTNGGVSVLSVANGTLVISNTAGSSSSPLTSLDVTNAILDLAVGYAPAVIEASTLNVGGATNTVNILSLPPLASYPVTLTVIQSLNPMSQFNFGLGSLPAGYTRSITEGNGTNVLLNILSGPVGVRPYVVWDGLDALNGVSTNWSDRLNWQFPGAPTPADNVIFNDTDSTSGSPFNSVGAGPGGIANPNNINNIVDQNFTIANLTFTNIGGNAFQNTYIDKGVTLTTSNFSVGSTTVDFGGTATEFVTIAGLNGSLNVNNTAAAVWVGLQSATENSLGSEEVVATLDMSGLGTFSANVSTFAVGALNSTVNYPAGVLYLAQTNTVTATGGAVAETAQNESLSLLVGETGKGVTTESFMYLGQMNTFNVNTIGIGIAKETGVMQFNAGLTGTPLAVFRAADGVSPVSTWAIGDGLAQTGSSSSPSGTADFSLGSVNALVSTMYLGRTPNASGAHPSTGALNLSAGIFSVATLYDGYQTESDTDNGAGAISLNGPGTLVVSGSLYLAATTGSTGASATTGTLNVSGGVARVNTIVADPTGNSAINLYGGALAVTNTTGTLTTLTFSPTTSNNPSATLQLQPSATNAPAMTVNTLSIDGLTTTTNVINISAMPAISSYPVEIPLIQYANFNNQGSVFNLGLGTFPVRSTPYVGVLTNDTASGAIAVLLSSGPVGEPAPSPTRFNVFTLSGTTLTLSGTNGVPNGQYVVLISTNLAQGWTPVATNNFSASGTFSFNETYSSTNQQRFYTIEQP